MVAAPYGSAASAAWTFAMGGLGIVIFYSLLSREGTAFVGQFFRAISTGLTRFTDPWTPLFPTARESSNASNKTTKPGMRKRNITLKHHRQARSVNQPIYPGGTT